MFCDLICRYIKLSSPRLNNVAVIGCILVYAAVIVLGFDDRNLRPGMFPVACTVSDSVRQFLRPFVYFFP